MQKGQLILIVQEEQDTFNVFKEIKHLNDEGCCMRVDTALTKAIFIAHQPVEPLKGCLVGIEENSEIVECVQHGAVEFFNEKKNVHLKSRGNNSRHMIMVE